MFFKIIHMFPHLLQGSFKKYKQQKVNKTLINEKHLIKMIQFL
jgi:hypothetical protein